MNFKVDENMPEEAADLLVAAGYEADTVRQEGLAGVDDPALAVLIQQEGRPLVTFDLEFGDIRKYPPQDYHGLIVLRSKQQDKWTLLTLVRKFIPKLTTEPLAGNLWIVEADRIRIWESTKTYPSN